MSYVRSLNAQRDSEILVAENIDEDAIELYQASVMALQVGVELGLTLRDLAGFFRRERLYQESGLEEVINAARYSLSDVEERAGRINFAALRTLLERKLAALAEGQQS